jgi:uncharacterized protein
MSDEQSLPNPEAERLTPVEARVLGCLIEKQATTPELYPLTLNALVGACNQKTSREPIMNLEPGQVGQTLRRMEARGLTRLVMGARADRWEHKADKALQLTPPQRILLGLLLLRGPQTVNELLTRSTRMHPFEDHEQVRFQLERLVTLGKAVRLPRQAGQREERYAHLLCGPVDVAAMAPRARAERSDESPHVLERLEVLEARVAELEARLAAVDNGTRDESSDS